MALERGYRVRCDVCGLGHFAAHEPSPGDARREAKRTGWARRKRAQRAPDVKSTGWQDLCPACAARMEATDG